MTDRPIIFSSSMVRALIEGRKTMTRRIIKPQPKVFEIDGVPAPVTITQVDGDPWPRIAVGRVISRQEVRFFPGMRLWVRETWCNPEDDGNFVYWADLNEAEQRDHRDVMRLTRDLRGPAYRPWRSPIHCPRIASRLTLIVSAVKIERLQDITEEDARAEGCERAIAGQGEQGVITTYRTGFVYLWGSLHGAESWLENPWVVAISATAIKANTDTLGKVAA